VRALVTAPYVGEIGWELMSWQGRVRRVFARGRFDRLIVLGAAGRSEFYVDMPLDYRTVDLVALPGDPYEDHRVMGDSFEPLPADAIRAAVREPVETTVEQLRSAGWEVQTLWPAYTGRFWPCDNRYQEFVRFHRPPPDPLPAPWVVLIQRTRSFGLKNWTPADWAELGGRLDDRGINTSIFPCDSRAAIEVLSACDLAVGQSTGGLHLAALCSCPRVVWSGHQYLCTSREMTNRQRYETWWNPFGAPVQVHEVTQLPPPAEAAEQVVRALEAIGRRTGSGASRIAFRAKWAVRSWLVRQVIQNGVYARWPWPIQRWVRYKLL